MEDQTRDTLKTLKKLLRAKKISYALLAKRLGLSLSSVKRLMSGHEISLGRVFAICDLLGIDLKDVMEIQAEQEYKPFTFSQKQEVFLSKSPHFLAYLFELSQQQSPAEIEKKWKITRKSTERYLQGLHSQGLIQKPANVGTPLKIRKHFSWDDNGVLGLAFSKTQIQDFTKYVTNSLGLPNKIALQLSSWILTEKNYSELREEIRAIEKKFRQFSRFNNQSMPADQIARYTFVAMADRWYETQYRTVIEI